MPKEPKIVSPLPGELVFAFSYVDNKDGSRFYHVLYNEHLDEYKDSYQLAGAIYKLILDYPQLAEPMLFITQKAAEDLSLPFIELLKNI